MWPNPQETADLDTFTEKILNGKPHFLCSANHEPGWISVLYSSYGTIQSSSKYVLCLEPATLLNIAFRIDKNFATFSKELPSNTMIYRIIIVEYAWWVDAIFFIGIPGLLCKPQKFKVFNGSAKYLQIVVTKFVSYFLLRSSTPWQHSAHMPTGLVAGIGCETLHQSHGWSQLLVEVETFIWKIEFVITF